MKWMHAAILILVGSLLVSGVAADTRKETELFEKAKKHLSQNEEKKALKNLESLLETNPDYPGAHHYVGIAYQQLGEYAESIRQFEQEVAKHDDAHSELALGVLYTHLLAFDEAEVRIQNALDAGLDFAHFIRAQLLWRQFRTADALASFRDGAKSGSTPSPERFLPLRWPEDDLLETLEVSARADAVAGTEFQPNLEIPDWEADRVGSILDDISSNFDQRICKWDSCSIVVIFLRQSEDPRCDPPPCYLELALVCQTKDGKSVGERSSGFRVITEGAPAGWCYHEDCNTQTVGPSQDR